MKKFFKCLTALFLCVMLAGCRFSSRNAENDRRFMVTALGFATDGALITVTAEIVTINSESPESEPAPQVLSHSGATVSEALDGIAASLSRPMLLEHCGVIVTDIGITPAWFGKICDYCFRENRITLSAYMIAADDPARLLSCEPESSVAVGYDIMGIIEQRSASSGISYDSRYFEIEGKRERGRRVFAMPYFARTKDGITLEGLSVFREDKVLLNLDSRDAGLYALMTGNFDSGTLRFGASEYHVNSRRVEYGYARGDTNKVTLKLHLSGDSLNKDGCKRLADELEALESRLKRAAKKDAFGFTDILSERFPDFENDREKFYSTAAFSAECILSGGVKDEG